MYRFVLFCLLLLAPLHSAQAQNASPLSHWSVTAGVDMFTDYLSDGLSKSGGSPVAQPWARISPHNRLQFGARISPIDLPQGRHAELSLDASTKWVWGPVHMQLGVAQFRTLPFVYTTHEASLQMGADIRGLLWGTLKLSRFDDGTYGIYAGTWQNFSNGWALSNFTKMIGPDGPYSYGTDVIKQISDTWTASFGFQSRLPEDTPIFAAKLTYRFR